MANSLVLFAHAVEAAEDHAAEAAHHVELSAFGLPPSAWVALAMLVLVLFAVFGAKVHKVLGSSLDTSIAEIRKQLDEARSLRAEAEALRKEYSDKIANAERDAASMIDHARQEAEAIVAKAEVDTADVIARREKMAEDKISAAELAAVSELRAKAASAAAQAAKGIIRQSHSAEADKVLVNQAIAEV